MDENKTWQVVITNQIGNDQDRDQIIERLAALFKIDNTRAAQLIGKAETIVKDNVDEATAKKYHLAISKTGAHCEILNKARTEEQLPDLVEPVVPQSPQAQEGLIKQPEPQYPEASEPVMSLIDKEAQDAKETREKLSKFGKIDPSRFCPECGTIRSAADAACLHCDYDPHAKKKTNAPAIGRVAMIVVLILLVIAAVGYFSMPYYKTYAKKSNIKNGLQLAIETRNQITQFILKSNFWPNQNIDANLPKHISNDVVAEIEITGNGAFTVTLHEQVLGKKNQTLIFKPTELGGKLVWNCTGGTLDNDYRPEICVKH